MPNFNDPYSLSSMPTLGLNSNYGGRTMSDLMRQANPAKVSTSPGGEGTNYDPYIIGGIGALSLLGPAFGKSTRAGQAFSSTASGAATGASIGSLVGPEGTVIGAGVGALAGFAEGELSQSPEEKRNAQMDQLRKSYENAKAEIENRRQGELSDVARNQGRLTGGLQKRYGNSAASRMSALGRTGGSQVEAAQLPITEQIAGQGSNALQSAMDRTNQQYDQLISRMDQDLLSAETQFRMGGEIPAGIPDYLSAIAPSAIKFAQNQQYGGIMNQMTNQVPSYAQMNQNYNFSPTTH